MEATHAREKEPSLSKGESRLHSSPHRSTERIFFHAAASSVHMYWLFFFLSWFRAMSANTKPILPKQALQKSPKMNLSPTTRNTEFRRINLENDWYISTPYLGETSVLKLSRKTFLSTESPRKNSDKIKSKFKKNKVET